MSASDMVPSRCGVVERVSLGSALSCDQCGAQGWVIIATDRISGLGSLERFIEAPGMPDTRKRFFVYPPSARQNDFMY